MLHMLTGARTTVCIRSADMRARIYAVCEWAHRAQNRASFPTSRGWSPLHAYVPTERDTGLCSTRLPGHFARRCQRSQAWQSSTRPCCEWISCKSISAGEGRPRPRCCRRLARMTTIRRRRSSGGIGGRCSSNEGCGAGLSHMLTSCSSRARGDQPPGPAVRLPRTQKEAQTEERRPNAGSPDRVHALKINPLGRVIREFL